MSSLILDFIHEIQNAEKDDYLDVNLTDKKIQELLSQGNRYLEEDKPTLAEWSFSQADTLQKKKTKITQKKMEKVTLRDIIDYELNEVWNRQKRESRAKKSVEKSDYYKGWIAPEEFGHERYLMSQRNTGMISLFLWLFNTLLLLGSFFLMALPLSNVLMTIVSLNGILLIYSLFFLAGCTLLSLIIYFISSRIVTPLGDEYSYMVNNTPKDRYWKKQNT